MQDGKGLPAGDDQATGERDADWLRLAQERAAAAVSPPEEPESPAALKKKLAFLRLRPWQTPH